MRKSTFTILLAEDEVADIELWKELLDLIETEVCLLFVRDGEEAMEFLQKAISPEHQTPFPDLLLLDLNLPKKNGFEVLGEIKQIPLLQSLIVILLTSSSSPMDIKRSYQLGANAFIPKPVDLLSLKKTIQAIESFWFSTAFLSPNPLE